MYYFTLSTTRSLYILFLILNVVIDPPSSRVKSSCSVFHPSPTPSSSYKQVSNHDNHEIQERSNKIKINLLPSQFTLMLLFILSLLSLLCYCWLQICNQTIYVSFSTNLNICNKSNLMTNTYPLDWFISVNVSILFLTEFEIYQMTCFAIYMNLNLLFLGKSLLRFKKNLSGNFLCMLNTDIH